MGDEHSGRRVYIPTERPTLYSILPNNKMNTFSMDIKQSDFTEAKDLAKIQIRMDNIDAEYVDKISDEIFQKQPFFLTTLLGYRFDVTPIELEEIMKIYFLIWEYFRTNTKVQTIKVTQKYFETVLNKNIALL